MDTLNPLGGTADKLRAAAFLSSVFGATVGEDDFYAVQLAGMLTKARDEGRLEGAGTRGARRDPWPPGRARRVTAEIEYQHRLGRYA